MKRKMPGALSILMAALLVMSSFALSFAEPDSGNVPGAQDGSPAVSDTGSGTDIDEPGGSGTGQEPGNTDPQPGDQTEPSDPADPTDPSDPDVPGGGEEPDDPPEAGCTEHEVTEWTVKTAPDCVNDGSEEGVCAKCGETVERTVPATDKHTWGSWKTVKAATYISTGVRRHACTVCGKTEDQTIKRLVAKNKWAKVSGKSYYLNSSGNVVKGWQKIKSGNSKKAKVKWCYFNSSGVFKKSVSKNTKKKWVTADGKKFYFSASKKPLGGGFHFIGKRLYYMYPGGAMAKGTFKAADGQTYKTTSKGYITGTEFYRHKYKSFILVDISDQKLWFYSGGKVRLTADVVTGKKGSHSTPTGVYKVRSKAKNIRLIGPTWNSKVTFWMAFIGSSYGLHDAPWRSSSEFSNHKTYLRNGSHGCINMRYNDAKYLYNNAPKGTAVIVQK